MACAVLSAAPAWGKAPPRGPTYEVTNPSGAYAGKRPKGWVVLIHGVGWAAPPSAMGFEIPARNRFNRWGWATLNVGYRPNRLALTDSLALYDWLRGRVGPRVPICTEGGSAGGHLALMVAVRRASVNCVVSQAGPADFVTVRNPLTSLARQTFGRHLRRWSPALLLFTAPTVAGCATNDPVVPCNQVTALARHHRNVEPVYLKPGDAFFVHTNVDADALKGFWTKARRLLARAAAAR